MDADRTFHTSRRFACSPREVYDAFVTAETISAWWEPDGFTNTFEIFEAVPGGRWKLTMHGPDGTNYPNENVITVLEPGSRWAIQHVSVPRFTLAVELSEMEDGTPLDWTQVFADGRTADAVRHIVEPANEQNLDTLGVCLKAVRERS